MHKLVATAASLGFLFLGAVTALEAQQSNSEIRHYALPAGLTYPESLTYDKKDHAVFAGSLKTQAIARLTLDGKESRLLSPVGGLFLDMHGLNVDRSQRLWVAGGRSGQIAVLDSHTGEILKRFQSPLDPKPLINDMVIVGSSVYFTDTWRPTLFRVGFAGKQFSEVESWMQFAGTSVKYAEGPNLNGIAASSDGRYLILVQTNTGFLFRLTIADKSVTRIDMGGEVLLNGDGLVLDGHTLYVLRPVQREIAMIGLSRDLLKGRVLTHFTNPALTSPTSAAKVGDRLMVLNSQPTIPATASASGFEILSIPIRMVSGK